MCDHEFYNQSEAAEYLELDPGQLSAMRKDDSGPDNLEIKIGRRVRILYTRKALGFWLQNQDAALAEQAVEKAKARKRKLEAKREDKIFRQRISDVVIDAGPSFGLDGFRRVLAEQGYKALKQIPVDRREDFISALVDAALADGGAQ